MMSAYSILHEEDKTPQPVKGPVTKSASLHAGPQTHMTEGENRLLNVVF